MCGELSARCLDFYHEQVKTRRRKLTINHAPMFRCKNCGERLTVTAPSEKGELAAPRFDRLLVKPGRRKFTIKL
jgi:hypothetical protein